MPQNEQYRHLVETIPGSFIRVDNSVTVNNYVTTTEVNVINKTSTTVNGSTVSGRPQASVGKPVKKAHRAANDSAKVKPSAHSNHTNEMGPAKSTAASERASKATKETKAVGTVTETAGSDGKPMKTHKAANSSVKVKSAHGTVSGKIKAAKETKPAVKTKITTFEEEKKRNEDKKKVKKGVKNKHNVTVSVPKHLELRSVEVTDSVVSTSKVTATYGHSSKSAPTTHDGTSKDDAKPSKAKADKKKRKKEKRRWWIFEWL
ncbi:hypothetical protein BDQ17DRAFT_1431716 [Cyathus striatus]|nr:hypothetical protein BDQ17DRAFT_1431716 [Cyathus striatus]